MKRRLPLAAGLVLAFASFWAFWPSPPDAITSEAHASAESSPEELPPPVARLTGGRVSGFVLRDGRPVARARVSLKAAGPLVTLTLDDGRFLFEDVPSGQVYLAASTADAASEVVGPLQVTPAGKIEDLQLTLTPSVKIEGRVIDLLTQKPVHGATVVSPTQASRTDEAGKFSLTFARTQTWIDVSAPGFLSRTEWVSLELASSGGKLELVLTPTSHLEGTVMESGVPVAAATVWAELSDGARRGEHGQAGGRGPAARLHSFPCRARHPGVRAPGADAAVGGEARWLRRAGA